MIRLLLAMTLVLTSFNSFATVKFAPQLVELDPKKRSSEITVINESKKDGVYEVMLVKPPYETSGDYQKELDLINKSIRFSPKRFTVKANSSQKVRVILRRNAQLKGPFLQYIKLSPIFDPNNTEKDAVSILQDFVFPLYTYFKSEEFNVELKSVKLEKVKSKRKDKKTKKETEYENVVVKIGYEGVERSPTRARYDILSKDGKVVHTSSIIFKKNKGVVEKTLPPEIKMDDLSKIRIKTFIGKNILKELNI